MAEIRTVGVCGAGLMGSGIAQTCASAGFNVVLMEVAQEPLTRGMAGITKSLDKFVEKGKLSQTDRDATVGRLKTTTQVNDLAKCAIVIEAIVENVDVKTTLFRQLDELLAPDAIICTNTSSLCVVEFAAKTKRPNKVAG
ncbi:MAG TPA: 3-hydroxyacyl-CoA dehydrogenase NAD-binding domain-containing protein, partial [Candidatus Baltobacteraceae bacterium]|nr:3-hydroxyacyl-CoA dehydrogenase NAD-binding domain-containing protein [Candidatus Baltobacteraceae bacterium]